MKSILANLLFWGALATPTNKLFFRQSESVIESVDEPQEAHANLHAWTVHTNQAFPRYSLRVSEQQQLCDPNVKQVSGYLDVDNEKHFYFWFFESRSKPATDPLLLWLNGGPGCSSFTGLLMELGPCRVDEGGKGTTLNPHSWNSRANIIFLDQPANVGFSYGGEGVSSSDTAAQDTYAFLQLFLTKYNKYQNLDFVVTGESYAGHYIPAIAKEIMDQNQVVATSNPHALVHIKLESVAIGNGLTDPLVQYDYYADMAADTKYGPVLSEDIIEDMRGKSSTCNSLIQACYQWRTPFSCVPGSFYCNSAMIQPFQQTGLNIYDIRKKCDPNVNPLCYSILNDIETFLNTPKVQQVLGVDVPFESCKRDINMKFLLAGDWMQPYVHYVAPLLESGVRVLIYAGDADFICNWYGNKAWTLALEWEGQEKFNAAKDHEWVSETTGRPAGQFRSAGNLSFLRVYEAGHMVPYDQPEHANEFLNAWIHGHHNSTR